MNIAIAQSGGPTCAINASLVGAFAEALKTPDIDAIFGSINGIEGIINNNLIDLKNFIRTNDDMELLKQTPSTVLGSCRYKLPDADTDSEIYEQIMNCFHKHNIRAFFYIGGNDSMDTVMKLSAYAEKHGEDVRIIGIPKTIDNDLCATDHTPGFGSAAKYVATTVQEIVCDSSVYSVESVTIIEIMGRHAGWLTASTCVIRANGVNALSGVGKQLENLVREKFGCKVRSIELNVMQRCSSHICSKTDIDEACAIGAAGVRAALAGETGKTMVFKRISDIPYIIDIVSVPASETANKEKFFPKEWITPDGTNVNEHALRYFLPLIQGENVLRMRNGMPEHFKIKEEVLK